MQKQSRPSFHIERLEDVPEHWIAYSVDAGSYLRLCRYPSVKALEEAIEGYKETGLLKVPAPHIEPGLVYDEPAENVVVLQGLARYSRKITYVEEELV